VVAVVLVSGSGRKPETIAAQPRRPATGSAAQSLRAEAAGADLIWIVLDAARADHFGAYGHALETTPNIDALMAESIVFDEAYAAAPNTKAAVTTLFTGQFPTTHGAVGATEAAPSEIPVLPELVRAAGFRTVCFSANPYLSAHFGFDRGFDEFHEVFREVDLEANQLGRVPAELMAEEAVKWLEENEHARFFAYLHFLEPHDPYAPPEPYDTMFVDQLPGRKRLASYDGNLRYADEAVGQVLDAIDRLGLAGHSVILITADHGEAFGEHGRFLHADTVYQETVHIPLSIRLPEGAAGRRSEIVCSTDMMPTLLDLFGLDLPETVQGRSRLALLAGEAEGAPHYAVSRTRGKDQTGGVKHPEEVCYALTVAKYTLLLGEEGRRLELYDRETDPAQRTNIADERPEVLRKLLAQFEAWADEQGSKPVVLGGTVSVAKDTRTPLSARDEKHLKALGYLK